MIRHAHRSFVRIAAVVPACWPPAAARILRNRRRPLQHPRRAGRRRPAVRVFVTNETSGDLTVIDAATQAVVATAPLGKRPRGIQVSARRQVALRRAQRLAAGAGPAPIESKLPPPDRSADGIGEIDADTYKVKRVIHAGNDPEQLAISADGTRLYVANEDTAQVSVVDAASGTIIATVKIGEEPEGVTIRPDGKVVYVTCEGDGAVYAIDTATNKVVQPHPGRPAAPLDRVPPDGSRAYVSLENDGAIAVVDAQQHKFLQRIQLEGKGNTPKPRPMGIAVHPDGSTVYVTAGSFGHLFLVDPAKNTPITSFEVGQRPWGIALSPDGKIAYTANGPSNDVSVIDLATSAGAEEDCGAGQRPWGIAVSRGDVALVEIWSRCSSAL